MQAVLSLGRLSGEKPFKFLFTWQMQRNGFEELAMSPEAGAIIGLGRQCKVLVASNFRKLPHRFIRVQLALVDEELVVY